MRAINASIGFDRALWRQDIRGSLAHAAMLAHVGIISAGGRDRHPPRAASHRRPDRGRRVPLGRGPRGHPHEHRGAADGGDRRGRQAPAHRAQPQRPGGARPPPLGARRDRRPVGAGAGRDAGARRARGGARRHGDAGLHPPPARAARDPRPPPARLCGDARRATSARLRGLPRAAGREPARRRGARRHRLPHRPPHDGARAGLRARPDAEQPRRRGEPRLRRRVPVLLRHVRDAPLAASRRRW